MSCGTCRRPVASGSCVDGFIHYLSGDYPCPFHPDKPAPRNLRELEPLSEKRTQTSDMSSEGLEDLL